jgi:hypothetical protein
MKLIESLVSASGNSAPASSIAFSQNRIWGYEALVRGEDGQGAGWVLGQVDEANRYKHAAGS